MNSIKIWEASTGKLKKVFKSPTKNEISCVKLEKRKRKLFVAEGKFKDVSEEDWKQMDEEIIEMFESSDEENE